MATPSVFRTKTAMGSYISTVAGLMILVYPQIEGLIERNVRDPIAKANTKDLVTIALLILGGGGAITGGATSFLGRLAAKTQVTLTPSSTDALLSGPIQELAETTRYAAQSASFLANTRQESAEAKPLRISDVQQYFDPEG
jgi:hypothetical protein